MSLPKEFENILADIEYICVAAETTHLTIFQVLESMTSIRKSPLLYAFPYMCQYITDCYTLYQEFTAMLLTCQDIMRDPRWMYRPLEISFINVEFSPEEGPFSDTVAITTDLNLNSNTLTVSFYDHFDRGSSIYKTAHNVIHKDIQTDVFAKKIFRHFSSRIDLRLITLGLSVSDTRHNREYRNLADDVRTNYGNDLRLSNLFFFSFDPERCRQDAILFRSTAESRSIIGNQVADHIRYQPGNAGFDDAAADFARVSENRHFNI